MIPAGQDDHSTKEDGIRWAEMKRRGNSPNNVDLLLEDRERTRERLFQIEMTAAKRSIQADQEGRYDEAQIHRDYGHYCKLVRTNRPVLDEMTKKGTR